MVRIISRIIPTPLAPSLAPSIGVFFLTLSYLQLDSDLKNENPKYKIKIHGHANGGAPGKIISMENDSKNFFSLSDTKEEYGSAKELSEERAEIIRDYLLANGIEVNRMEVKAWGGKRPIHDKHSTRAQENVRVEIEILEN